MTKSITRIDVRAGLVEPKEAENGVLIPPALQINAMTMREHMAKERLEPFEIQRLYPEEFEQSSVAWIKEPEYEGIVVVDPDGWDRENLEASVAEPITEAEFRRRLVASTCVWPPGVAARFMLPPEAASIPPAAEPPIEPSAPE